MILFQVLSLILLALWSYVLGQGVSDVYDDIKNKRYYYLKTSVLLLAAISANIFVLLYGLSHAV